MGKEGEKRIGWEKREREKDMIGTGKSNGKEQMGKRGR